RVEAELAAGTVGAVLVEPVLGRGGCIVPPEGFLRRLCELAHSHGALVIADEIWTGLGRCGAMLRSAEQDAGVDIVCVGKGLGGGLPISACIAPEAVMRAWTGGDEVIHTSTHVGAPLCCAAAVATIDAVRFRKLAERARELGERILTSWRAELAGCPHLVELRGVGLMLGIELDSGASALRAMRELLLRGYVVLTGGVAGEVITLTPALTIEERLLLDFGQELRQVLERLE
ncbi:MAG: aminotransferase class III-fold pyridoxal phosphate-dependent enzyme, partial [Deltaproteobacteria bacterium]|nr:aminotransferase class III-fold pyridoxal phosphate-dependent enzyme [Deltaproteobacteria bacterium]